MIIIITIIILFLSLAYFKEQRAANGSRCQRNPRLPADWVSSKRYSLINVLDRWGAEGLAQHRSTREHQYSPHLSSLPLSARPLVIPRLFEDEHSRYDALSQIALLPTQDRTLGPVSRFSSSTSTGCSGFFFSPGPDAKPLS